MKPKGRHSKRLCQKLLAVMMMMIGCSLSLSSNDLFHLTKEKSRSLPILAAASVHSITACAQFCTTFADCASFNLKLPVGATGNKRLCEATKDESREDDLTFNIYEKLVTIEIVPTEVEYKSYDIPDGEEGCHSNRVITTIIFNPNDATNSDIDEIICGKIKEPWQQEMDDDDERMINTIGDSAQTCTGNTVLQGFESDEVDEEWTGHFDMKGRCHLLKKWNVDKTSCLDALPINNLSHYPDIYVDSDDTSTWNSWITCPYFHFAVGIKREEIDNTGKYKILSMNCCKIIGPP